MALAAAGLSFASTPGMVRKRKALILGGTQFVGPATVSSMIRAGYEVTLFNRGITNPSLFPQLHLIKGDRQQGLAAYREIGGEWDVVIDVWPEQHHMVDEATRSLKDQTKSYVFISSVAVYGNWQEVGITEQSKTLALPEDQSDWYYGENKLAAEQLVRDRFSNHLIVRPGPIKGWRDPAYDLLYWIVRLEKGLEILGPGTGSDPLQFVDVKDVGTFISGCLEKSVTGTYNLTGPSDAMTWKYFLDKTSELLSSQSVVRYPDESFLSSQGVRSFEDLPLWAPLSEDRGFMQISAAKARETGFSFRDTNETVEDCLRWYHKLGRDVLPEGGLSRSKEEALLSLLKE